MGLYVYEIVAGHVIFLTVEIILMLRVYLLFDRSRTVAKILFLCWCITLVIDIVLQQRTRSLLHFDPYCLTDIPASDTIAFSVTGIFMPLIIMVLTLVKYARAFRDGWGKTPLLITLVRDGVSSFSIILAVWIVILIMACVVRDQPTLFGHYLFLGIVPSLGCRVIINLQKTGIQDRGPQLTSVDMEPPQSETTFALGYPCHPEEYTYP
jgi:hypothetical protein